MTKCIKCDRTSNDMEYEDGGEYVSDYDGDYLVSVTGDTGWLCDWCSESFYTYASTIVVKLNGHEYKYYINDGIVANFPEHTDGSPEDPRIFEAVKTIARGEVWVQTDGWRGYTDFKINDGITQFGSDAILAWHHTEEKLKERHDNLLIFCEQHDIPLFTVIGRTSNVFSQTLDYFVFNADFAKIQEFLGETSD